MYSPLDHGPLITLRSVDSTQNVVAALLSEGKPVGGVLAEEQTAGRGRFGRAWSSPPGQCLAVSLVFKPHPKPYLLGMGLALACAEAFGCQVQWPNDVVFQGKKVGGILTELHADSSPIVGVGLNLSKTAYPVELSEVATSLTWVTGQAWDPSSALHAMLEYFCDLPELHSWKDLEDRWSRVDATPGKPYRLQDGRQAVAVRVGPDGELLCLANGVEQRVLAADAILGAPG